MTKFTNKQLIDQARVEVDFWRERDELIPSRQTAIRLRLAEITLAALTAEPVAWTDAEELSDANKGYSGYLFAMNGVANKFADPCRQMLLYTAPPAPVVPDGYVLVPIIPTEDMIINGFEAELEKNFVTRKRWKHTKK